MAYHRSGPVNSRSENDDFYDVFAEFDFGYVDYGCNFFCPECRNMLKCDAYKEVGKSWESFYM